MVAILLLLRLLFVWYNQSSNAGGQTKLMKLTEKNIFRLLAWVQLDRISSTTVCGPGMVNGRIDHDYFWPHNIARHVLTSNDIGYSKVKSLEKVANHIQSDSDLVAIASDVFGKDKSLSLAFGQSDIILDASASISVERQLALDVKSDARRISCFLKPQGTATIMLL